MARVNEYNWEDYYNRDTGVDMTKEYTWRDKDDTIDLEDSEYQMDIVGGWGDDNITGSKHHMNIMFGDYYWGLGYSTSSRTEKTYNGYSGDDTINGGRSIDFIHGGRGNDRLNGNWGTNLFQFKAGDGYDNLYMGGGNDYLYFCDKSFDELSYERNGDHLVVRYGKDDAVTVKNYFDNVNNASLKGIADKKFNISAVLDAVDNMDLEKYERYLREGRYYKAEKELSDREENLTNNLNGKFSRTTKVMDAINKKGIKAGVDKASTVKGTPVDDTINGSKYNDTLYGIEGNDTIKGGSGNDYISGSKGDDKLYGEDNNDTIKAGSGDDYINGGNGNDEIYAQHGTNTIVVGAGNDKIWAGTGKDKMIFSKNTGNNIIYNANKNDFIKYNDTASFDDLKFTKSGNHLVISRKNGYKTETVKLDSYFKNSENLDKIILSDGSSYSILKNAIINITGKGTIKGSSLNDKISGSNTKDSITGSYGNDTIYGNDGNDTIKGNSGIDKIYGGDGNDSINSGNDNDYIFGGKGNDSINAGKGTNQIYFNKNNGNDTIISGSGEDYLVFLNENMSNIKAKYSGENLLITYSGGSVNLKDFTDGNHSAKFIKVGSETKNIIDMAYYNVKRKEGSHNLTGTDVNDKINSDQKYDIIKAKNGDDLIYLKENGGFSKIYMGAGKDTVYDEAGNNTFYMYSGNGNDSIRENTEIGASNTLIFSGASSLDDLNFIKNSNGYTIKYNNGKDSVRVFMTADNYEDWTDPNADDSYFDKVQIGTTIYKVYSNGINNPDNNDSGDLSSPKSQAPALKEVVAGWISSNSTSDFGTCLINNKNENIGAILANNINQNNFNDFLQ
ncbi:hypothetical protein IKP85_02865 [bacterium]|nr:hypothetical protein [bacterium]